MPDRYGDEPNEGGPAHDHGADPDGSVKTSMAAPSHACNVAHTSARPQTSPTLTDPMTRRSNSHTPERQQHDHQATPDHRHHHDHLSTTTARPPHDPAHPTSTTRPATHRRTHTTKVRHDATDEWQNLTARAVFIDDCFTGPILELGPGP
ncbi:hypothetical protein GTA09_31295 [Rhodococcus hoagii]|nr:hypothetical protein [Prescottella equi]